MVFIGRRWSSSHHASLGIGCDTCEHPCCAGSSVLCLQGCLLLRVCVCVYACALQGHVGSSLFGHCGGRLDEESLRRGFQGCVVKVLLPFTFCPKQHGLFVCVCVYVYISLLLF